MSDSRVRTHSMGVMCGKCKEQLVPDNCCPDQQHGSTYQQPNDWARLTWPDHPCFQREQWEQ